MSHNTIFPAIIIAILISVAAIIGWYGIIFRDNPFTVEPKTIWVGYPMVSDGDQCCPSDGYLTEIQFGLRADGVVIWQRVPQK